MLNVLIGPNGSGKSNLFDVFKLLRSVPVDLQDAVRRGGGLASWLWAGDIAGEPSLEVVVKPTSFEIEHSLVLRCMDSKFGVAVENIKHLPDCVIYRSDLDTGEARVRVLHPDGNADSDADRPPMVPGPGLRWARLDVERAARGPLVAVHIPTPRISRYFSKFIRRSIIRT